MSRAWPPPRVSRSPYASAFGDFDGRIWLNAAHQGPLPMAAAEAARRAIDDKQALHRISDDSFIDVPRRLRETLGRLIGAPASEVILGNSASYGLQLLANALPWAPGDEVLVPRDEFPATVFPWLVATQHGIRVRQLDISERVLGPDRLESELSSRTRVVCLNWVRSLTGDVVDLLALAELCVRRGIWLVVNATQGVGAMPFSVQIPGLAAVTSSGFKWLCGPYATGFCWIEPSLVQAMKPIQAYWLALPEGGALDLNAEGEHRMRDDLGARAFDVFGTANFLNFTPWTVAVDYLLGIGIERIDSHNRSLVARLIDGAKANGFELLSPEPPARLSHIAAISVGDRATNLDAHRKLAEAGVDVALRGGNLRFSPHLYNSTDEIDFALEVLRR